MRFKCNLRLDPVDGEKPKPDDWEGFYKQHDGVLYRIPIHYDKGQRMWYMHYGAGVSLSDAIEDGTNNARKQPVDLTEDDQVNYEQHCYDHHAPDRFVPYMQIVLQREVLLTDDREWDTRQRIGT